ncbi:hypothetical protein P1X14_12375 [Sphingomonas sp. AOB5]|uniref:hypothetical protein n=1 Tax=Sphingomonas sp. AOB5 TaxID=3034017 RepID=UPI0023F78659|nr:hypothetical protein [Sphingomonas sp. AOB5]MDF7776046.1 hypothetical protein [Sphingomonas sp. AOB5]
MVDPTPTEHGVELPESPSTTDARGQAAMLLVESLIHGLIERSVISVSDAVEIVSAAIEVEEEIRADMSVAPTNIEETLVILGGIRASLEIDLARDSGAP